ncbi:hypothetical protein [Legionella cardiaca]
MAYQSFAANIHSEHQHHHQHHVKSVSLKKLPTVHLTIEKIIDRNGKKVVFFKLIESATNKLVRLSDLQEIHTQKIHLLVIDDSLSDYSHVHPQATQEPGVYQFEWQPARKNATYRAWADLVPLKTNTQEYIITDLITPKSANITHKINNQPFYESVVDGYHFKLSFDKATLEVGQPAMGKIIVTNAKGQPIHFLQPIMGAFAHIVGFNDDLKTVVHLHPMGKEPTKATDQGGPELLFHLEPEKAGFTKIFAQVKIHGKELFAPFGVIIEKTTQG